jgi:hypothetical protein
MDMEIEKTSMHCVTGNVLKECVMFQACPICVSKELEDFPMDAV